MKYIIEIEDEPFGRNDDPLIPHGMDELYRAKGFRSLVFDENGLNKLTPYVEPAPKMTGWICPTCGRGLSPFIAVCPCKNDNRWQITCEWQERREE